MSDSERTPPSKSPDVINNNSQERNNPAKSEHMSKPNIDRTRSRSPQDTDRDLSNKEATDTRSPRRSDDRRRSRSPREDRQQRNPRRKDAGFKWKEKRRDEDENRDEGLRRDYRDQYKPRRRSRSRSRSRDRSGYGDNQDRDRDSKRPRRRSRSRSRSPRRYDSYRGGRDDRRDRDRDRQREDKPDRGKRGDDRYPKNNFDRQPTSRPAPPSSAPTGPPQEMIQVTINDRLGTKKQIPCLPTDTIKDFKAVVAMMIGRRPHEILLKRQSERPFKDFLTLQDYGVSNGASLDLEVDTGD